MRSVGKHKQGEAMRRTITVKASFDPEANVWYVEESDLPGLSAEADTLELLAGKLSGMVADLFEENGFDDVPADSAPPIELIAHQFISAKRFAAA